jgi:hypothetical protein
LFEYQGKINVVRGNLLGLPQWARGILFLVALPGMLAVALSFVLVVCSLAALLLVTVPVYSILRMLTAPPQARRADIESSGSRHVDVKIIE